MQHPPSRAAATALDHRGRCDHAEAAAPVWRVVALSVDRKYPPPNRRDSKAEVPAWVQHRSLRRCVRTRLQQSPIRKMSARWADLGQRYRRPWERPHFLILNLSVTALEVPPRSEAVISAV